MRKVVFMIGSGHTGSTLLSLILGSHSSAFAIGEMWSIARGIGGTGEKAPAICGICPAECPFWNEPSHLSVLRSYFGGGNSRNWLLSKLYGHFGSLRMDIYRHLFEWTGADVLIDSTKAEAWSRRQLKPPWYWREVVPLLIYTTRDGRAVTNSYLRKYPDADMASEAKRWAEGTLRREQYFQDFSEARRIRVAYEQLATKPGKVMRSICSRLGIKYEPEMLRYWQHEHHIVAGNTGTRSLILRWQERLGGNRVQQESGLYQVSAYAGETYYDHVGLAIKLDTRWTRELSSQQLDVFESIAGPINERYAWLVHDTDF